MHRVDRPIRTRPIDKMALRPQRLIIFPMIRDEMTMAKAEMEKITPTQRLSRLAFLASAGKKGEKRVRQLLTIRLMTNNYRWLCTLAGGGGMAC